MPANDSGTPRKRASTARRRGVPGEVRQEPSAQAAITFSLPRMTPTAGAAEHRRRGVDSSAGAGASRAKEPPAGASFGMQSPRLGIGRSTLPPSPLDPTPALTHFLQSSPSRGPMKPITRMAIMQAQMAA
jgi:hypothetical protein